MGGGASKSHSVESAPPQENVNTNTRQKTEAYHHDDGHQVSSSISHPEYRDRSHTQANNHDEEYSSQHSRDRHEEDDDFDCHPSHDDERDDDEMRAEDEEAMQLRILFAQSAMSMDMDNEDLIFNLMYFGGDTSNFASMMNSAAEETVAAHSAGNTPYKLTPATEGALSKLNVMIVTETLRKDLNLQECSICQEELEVGCAIAEMPGCGHCFHNECVMKWFALQSWCPVCRTKILPEEDCCGGAEVEEQCARAIAKPGLSPPLEGRAVDVKANLGELFSEVDDDRMEEAF